MLRQLELAPTLLSHAATPLLPAVPLALLALRELRLVERARVLGGLDISGAPASRGRPDCRGCRFPVKQLE
jgi:hypothetical protein